MKPIAPKPQRCAIYTRKSTEHNLDLAFNSLDAQREACEAYVKSQAHEGWRLIREKLAADPREIRRRRPFRRLARPPRPAGAAGRGPRRKNRHHRRLQDPMGRG
jgi:hypothetical protein